MGVDIKYSNVRESYYYADARRIVIKVERAGEINEKCQQTRSSIRPS